MRKYSMVLISVLAIALDRLIKAFTHQLSGPVTLIPGVIGLRPAENRGMAFGMLSGHPVLLAALSLVILGIGWAVLRNLQLGAMSRAGAALLLSGAMSNLADRLTVGYVTDMIELLFVRFAIFNVADICVCVGVALLALSMLVRPEEWKEKSRGDGV